MKPLISDSYRALNAELHQRKAKYGGKGDDWATRVIGYINDAEAASWLDYGCGKKNLLNTVEERMFEIKALNQPGGFTRAGYDPVTEPMHPREYRPDGFDFVTCNDVLEHIEPELLDNVLEDIAAIINNQGLLVISQRLANKRLADGRNAHLIVEKTPWWIKRLKKHFWQIIEVEPIKPKRRGVELAVLVRPRKENQDLADDIRLLDPARP